MESQRNRRRGRPVGAKAQILSTSRTRALGIHHFAFLRAWLQGLDLKWAWDRYVAFSESSSDLRHIEARRKEMLATLLRLGHQINLTLPPERQITSLLNTLSREPVIAPASVLPSLDEFVQIQGLDPDAYSEAELLEVYEDHYASAQQEESEPSSSSHVKALNHLAGMLATPPSPSDSISSWFDEKLARKIMASGAIQFSSLIDLINVYGYNWFRRIPYLGEVRAKRIVAWLMSAEHHFGKGIRENALIPPQREAITRQIAVRDVELPRLFGMVPLSQLLVPSPLRGDQGIFRTQMPNTLGAHDDLQAVQNWLKKYEERPHTLRSYRKEVERFYLWCLHERRKPLSSIDAIDCQAYRGFLAKIPTNWISPRGTLPGETDWRPFRKQMEPSSQKLALVIVQTLFTGLREAGYLVANPMSAVMKGFNLPSPRINPDRSFDSREWDYLMHKAHQEPDSANKGRLILLLELLVGMGLRADELTQAKRSDLRRVPVKDDADAWILVVTGKRRKQREVPVPDYVIDLIHAHHQAFDEAGAPPSPALVRAFEGVPQWSLGENGAVLTSPKTDGGLGHSGLYAVLKTFFRRIAKECNDPLIDPEHLTQGSTHWLRHTFGRQAAADDVPLEVIQQALGHTSLATTTIYTSTERDRMIKAMRNRNIMRR